MNELMRIPLNKVICLDIETVSQKKSFDELDADYKKLWEHKAKFLIKEEQTAADVYDKASIYAEFGKVICIGLGIFQHNGNNWELRVKSISGHDEKQVLREFGDMCAQYFNTPDYFLCAHNGKEFDFPYLSRRFVIQRLPLPVLLDTAGRKPWEIHHLDTMELWKFGDYKHYTSIPLLTKILGIPTPKDDIDGSMVGQVYWQENNLERIATYCKKDVISLAQILMRYRNQELIDDTNIIFS